MPFRNGAVGCRRCTGDPPSGSAAAFWHWCCPPLDGALSPIGSLGNGLRLVLLLITIITSGIGASCAYLIPWSLLPDAIDADPEKPAGQYSALIVLAQKICISLALFFFGNLMSFSGYQAAQNALQPASALIAIRLCMGLIPALLVMLGLVVMRRWPPGQPAAPLAAMTSANSPRTRRLPRPPRMPRWLNRLLASLLIGGQAVTAIARGRVSFNDLMQELLEAGPGSFLIVVITSLAAGTVLNIQVVAELSKQGASSAVGGLLALGLSREMSPLLTATLLTGKVATAYAAQLGTMKVTEQIDAITMLRTDPVDYLVVPRLLAMVVMAPVQCLLFFVVGIWSGQLSSTWLYNIPPSVFWTSVRTWMQADDLPSMLFKALVFGIQIAVISCGWGLTTQGGPKEVGSTTTGAVVVILVTVALMDALLTKVLFG